MMKSIRRTLGAPEAGRSPVKVGHLRTITAALDAEKPLDIRDRALLLIGFAGAFRRSELVGLNIEDLEFNDDGLIVHLRRSKTDSEGQGRKVGIPYGSTPATCPVRALQDWLVALKSESGPVFRVINRHNKILESRLSSKAVPPVVKRLTAKHSRTTSSGIPCAQD